MEDWKDALCGVRVPPGSGTRTFHEAWWGVLPFPAAPWAH